MDTNPIAAHPHREAEACAAQSAARATKAKRRGPFGFARREDGATAVEFAIVLPVFLFMVFIIFETAMTYWANRLLQMHVSDLSRFYRTGFQGVQKFRADGTPIPRPIALCEDGPVAVLFNCDEMMIETELASTMAPPPRKGDGTVDRPRFTENHGGSGTVNVVRVYYNWTRLFDIPVTPVGVPKPDNKLELYAASGFVVE